MIVWKSVDEDDKKAETKPQANAHNTKTTTAAPIAKAAE